MDRWVTIVLTSSFLASLPTFIYGVIKDRRASKAISELGPEQKKSLLQEANDTAIKALRDIDKDRVEDISRLRERIRKLETEVDELRIKLRTVENEKDEKEDANRRLIVELESARIEVQELSEALRVLRNENGG